MDIENTSSRRFIPSVTRCWEDKTTRSNQVSGVGFSVAGLDCANFFSRFQKCLFRDWSKSIGGAGGGGGGGRSREGVDHDQWVGCQVQFSATLKGWVTLFYYIDRH